MEVHIRRRHPGMNLALNNLYRAINARSFGYPNYNLKSNYSPNSVIFNDGESAWGQTNWGDREGECMDHIINFLSKQMQIKDLTDQLMPPHYQEAYSQQLCIPALWVNSCKDRPTFRPHHFINRP